MTKRELYEIQIKQRKQMGDDKGVAAWERKLAELTAKETKKTPKTRTVDKADTKSANKEGDN